MKEQWKKLDSDAKLLVNVEEGKALPVKIELPLSALIPNRDDNFKRLLTILRIVFLLFLLLLLSFAVALLYTRYYSRSNIEFHKEALVNLEHGLDSDVNKLVFKNKVYQQLGDEIKSNDVDDTTRSVQESTPSDVPTNQSSDEKILPEVFVIKMTPMSPLTEAQPLAPANGFKWLSGNSDGLANTLTQAMNELVENQSGIRLEEAIAVTQNENYEIEELEPTDSLGINENLSDVTNAKNDITDLFSELLLNFAQMAQEDIDIGNIDESSDFQSTGINREEIKESEIESKNINEDVSKNNEEKTEESDNEQIFSEEKTVPEQNINSENSEEQEKMVDVTKSFGYSKFDLLDLINKVKSSEEKTSVSEDTVFMKQAFFIADCLEDIVGTYHELLAWYIYEYNQDLEDTDDNINDKKKLYAAKAMYNWNIEDYEQDLMDLVDQLATSKCASRYTKFMADDEEYNNQPSELQNYIFKRLMVKSDLDKYFKEHPNMAKDISSALYYLIMNEVATSTLHSSSNENSATSDENKDSSDEIVSETTTVENISSYEVLENGAVEDSSENFNDQGEGVTIAVETSNDNASDEVIGTTVAEEQLPENSSDDGTRITEAVETSYENTSNEDTVKTVAGEYSSEDDSENPVLSSDEKLVLAAMKQVARFEDEFTPIRNNEDSSEEDHDDSTTYDNKLDSIVQAFMAVLDEYNEDETSESGPAQNLSEDNVPEESVDVEEAEWVSQPSPVQDSVNRQNNRWYNLRFG